MDMSHINHSATTMKGAFTFANIRLDFGLDAKIM
jgi:hypothetical protein